MTTPVTPVDAATVILVRKADQPDNSWECFMVRRHVLSDFAADVFVFPGGKVDPIDRETQVVPFCSGVPACETQSDIDNWRALRLAATRELFEEAGVLLAHRPHDELQPLDDEDSGRFSTYRRQMHAGDLSLLDLAARENLVYPLDRLHAMSRWVTPEILPRRYDTWFFIACMPGGQQPVHDDLETTEGIWIAPATALERWREGSFPLVFATEKHLECLCQFRSVESLIVSTESASLEPVVPRIVQSDGETRFFLPGEEGY